MCILGARFPSREQVLLYFIYLHQNQKKTVAQATAETSVKIKDIYKKANLPCLTEANIRLSIKKLHNEYMKLKERKIARQKEQT